MTSGRRRSSAIWSGTSIARRSTAVYVGAIDALGSFGGPDAVEALKEALQHGDWMAPLAHAAHPRLRRAGAAPDRHRPGGHGAARGLDEGSRGVRAAARAELKRLG